MGMDLYSKRKPRGKDSPYYQFNWAGWGRIQDFLLCLGCDLSEFSGRNDGDLVGAETCTNIAYRLYELKGQMRQILDCHEDQLPTFLGGGKEYILDWKGTPTNILAALVEHRLKSPEEAKLVLTQQKRAEWDMWECLRYYLGFGDFCQACSRLGGFTQN